MSFDVNAARAQRAEARGSATFTFTVDAESYSIPFEPTLEASRAFSSATTVDAELTALVGAEQAEGLFKHSLSVADIRAIFKAYEAATALPLESDKR